MDNNFTVTLDRTLKPDARTDPFCAYSNITYDCAEGPTGVNYTGNYFEVTILKLGRKEIGIGLASKGVFPPQRFMPGWEEGSYGYHGDDGQKFGSNATFGIWPFFEVNDVIGCGFDFHRKAIFYTRNGELLGDGFEDVSEEKLSPIVGFVNRNSDKQSVRINFGIEPFKYNFSPPANNVPSAESTAANPEIFVNKAALAERNKVDSSDASYIPTACWPVIKSDMEERGATFTHWCTIPRHEDPYYRIYGKKRHYYHS